MISWNFLGESLAALGIPDPGRVTTASLPFLRATGWMTAALAVGSFLSSAFLISPIIPDGDNTRLLEARLSVDGHIAARTGAVASLCFGMIALFMVPLVLSDVSGTPLVETLAPAQWGTAISQVAESQAWLWVAIISLVVGFVGLFPVVWRAQPLLLFGSLLALIPIGLEGHSAAGGDHDYGTNSLIWHLIFMALWVGGLMALLAHCRRLGPGLPVAVRRYSRIAFVAALSMAGSGLINAAIRVEFQDWFTTTYGRIIVAKTVGVVLLAFCGFLHRLFTIPALEQEPTRARGFRRLAVGEVVVMAAVVGIAITMGRTPPPPPRDPNLSTMAIAIGFDLWKEPTTWNIWTMWRFDIMFTLVALVLAGAYLWGLHRLRQQSKTWSRWRTFWFLLGCATQAAGMSNGIGMNMMATFSMHMVAHMMLTMVIPVFLVLGAPFTLVKEAVPPGPPGQPGLHEWVDALCNSRLLRWITHPGINTVQFVSIFYLLYVTPFYSDLVSEHGGHLAMNWVFLFSGYVYFWDMIGPDPSPNRRSPMVRLMWLVFSMPFHLFFGVYLMQLTDILGEDFYVTLQLPWHPDLLEDQRVGGGIAWASGAFPLVVVFGALFLQWRRQDKKDEEAYDAKVEANEDDEFKAYNQMLAQLNQGQRMDADYYERDMRDGT